jgi:MFS family permease
VLRFAPILVFGIFTGVIGDRVDRRRLLVVTQALHTTAATTMAVVVFTTTPTLLLLYGIALTHGLINAVDNPVRRSFIRDLTDETELSNAVSLHNSVGTLTRGIGPVIAGSLIVGVGVKWCFAINALSFVAVLLSLVIIDRTQLRPAMLAPRGPGQTRAGIRYARAHRPIRRTLILATVMAVFAWQWNVILPVYVTDEFQGDARLFGFLVFALSVGSLVGAIYSARLPRLGGQHLRGAGAALGIALGGVAIAPELPIAFVALALLGAAGSAFNIAAQSRIQLAVEDEMTSRVMALYSVSFTGAKPIGGLVAGLVIDASSSRFALGLGSLVIAIATLLYVIDVRRRAQRLPDEVGNGEPLPAPASQPPE